MSVTLLAALLLLFSVFWMRPINRLLVGVLAALTILLAIIDGVLLARTLTEGKDVVIGDRQSPVAAVLILDTAPRMEYRQENQTRLEKSKELAFWLVNHLPPDRISSFRS